MAFTSLIGISIEFYIYGLAGAMVIGAMFFPSSDATAQSLNAFLTRPFSALLFGHFGGRVGRKTMPAELDAMFMRGQ